MAPVLPERAEKLFLAFKMAIEDERRAQGVYQKAKDLCGDHFVAQVFEELYQEEVVHERQLMERYKELRHELDFDAA